MFHDERPSLNSLLALERIRALLDGESALPDGQLPPERELAARMGLGRRAVRRALEVLEAEGRIWRQQGRGTFVGPRPVPPRPGLDAVASRSSPMEVMEAREEIEPTLARLAAMRASYEDIDALDHLAEKTAAAVDADSRELWDGALHRRIAEAAANTLLLALFDVVDRIRQEPDWRHLRELVRTGERHRAYVEQHARIIDAIRRRDGAGAENAMRAHLTSVHGNLRALMRGAGGAPVLAGAEEAEER